MKKRKSTVERRSNHYFEIGRHVISIGFIDEDDTNSMSLLPAFETFATSSPPLPLLFTLTVDDSLRPSRNRRLIRTFDTGNGDVVVYRLPDDGYQFIMRNIQGDNCCLLIADSHFSQCRCALNGDYSMRSFGLNNAVMMAFAFAASYHNTILVHASTVTLPHPNSNGMRLAFPFVAASGTGKSTHTSLWLKTIADAELINDDNLIIRIEDGTIWAYGSPWSGKTPCYRKRRAVLGAVTRIERAPTNSIRQLAPVEAFASILPACSNMKWDEAINGNICDTISAVLETTPQYTLYCLPDDDAALLSHKTLTDRWKKE